MDKVTYLNKLETFSLSILSGMFANEYTVQKINDIAKANTSSFEETMIRLAVYRAELLIKELEIHGNI